PEVWAAMATLHGVLRAAVPPRKRSFEAPRVWSSLTGAVVLVPDAPLGDVHDHLPAWLVAAEAAGLSVRAGVSRGVVKDNDRRSSTISVGQCINVAARLASSSKNPGILYEASYADYVGYRLANTHFLHPRRRVDVQLEGKGAEVLTCFADPD